MNTPIKYQLTHRGEVMRAASFELGIGEALDNIEQGKSVNPILVERLLAKGAIKVK